MSEYTPDFSFFSQAFQHTPLAGITWIVPIMVVAITMLLITRDPNKWKVTFLPTLLSWRVIGLETSMIFIGIAVLLFVQESLQMDVIGNIVSATSLATTTLKDTVRGRFGTAGRERQMNIFEHNKKYADTMKRKRMFEGLELNTNEQKRLNKMMKEEENKRKKQKYLSIQEATKEQSKYVKDPFKGTNTGLQPQLLQGDYISLDRIPLQKTPSTGGKAPTTNIIGTVVEPPKKKTEYYPTSVLETLRKKKKKKEGVYLEEY